jgi:D-glycero-D-manno-heptose 1,7-bisphosphate phosphatase
LNRYIFLDRDGTIIPNIPYLSDSSKVIINDEVIFALNNLTQAGFQLVVVTNQSGINRGLIKLSEFFEINRTISEILQIYKIQILDFLFCPHMPEELCKCRKPEIALFDKFSSTNKVDKKNSYLIGDQDSDILAGIGFGVKSIKIGMNTLNQQSNLYLGNSKNFLTASIIILKDFYSC